MGFLVRKSMNNHDFDLLGWKSWKFFGPVQN